MKKILRYILLTLIIIYLVMYFTAFPVVLRAKEIFMGNPVVIEDHLVKRYSWKHVGEDADRSIKIIPYFTLHNFVEGSIWVYYEFEARDEKGACIGGSIAPSQWKIRRTADGWEVYDIIEAP